MKQNCHANCKRGKEVHDMESENGRVKISFDRNTSRDRCRWRSLFGATNISTPRFAQEKYTPDPASCAFEIHEWKLKMSQLGRLIPRFPRNNHSIEKNTELDHPASFDDVVRSPGKIANWSIEIGTRNEISIVLIIEKRKRNEIFRRIFPCFLREKWMVFSYSNYHV